MNWGNAMEAGRVVMRNSGKWVVLTMLAMVLAFTSGYSADAELTFAGGSGAPLTITLETPMVYIATVSSGSAPAFIFKNVGSFYSGIFYTEGDITFSINGGAAQAITGTQWNFSNNDVTAVDLILFGDFGTVNAGDMVRLNAGTITTVDNMAGTLIPASGAYESFISDQPGDNIGSGSAVPEPSPLALGVVGLAGVFMLCRAWSARKVRAWTFGEI